MAAETVATIDIFRLRPMTSRTFAGAVHAAPAGTDQSARLRVPSPRTGLCRRPLVHGPAAAPSVVDRRAQAGGEARHAVEFAARRSPALPSSRLPPRLLAFPDLDVKIDVSQKPR